MPTVDSFYFSGGRKGAAVLCELVPGELREPPEEQQYGNWYPGAGGGGGGGGGDQYNNPSYGQPDMGYPDTPQGYARGSGRG